MAVPEGLAGARVLDLLCRSGKGALKLADAVGPQGHVLACDPDAAFVAQAEQRRAGAQAAGDPAAARVSFAQAYPEDLAALAASGSFDLVYVNSSLNVVCDLPAVFAEAARVLAPGGVLWVAGGVFADSPEDERARARSAATGNVFAAALTRDEFAATAHAAGFSTCTFTAVAPCAPDGADADASSQHRTFREACARLERD